MSLPTPSNPAGSLAHWRNQCPLDHALRAESTRGGGIRVALLDTAISPVQLRDRHPDSRIGSVRSTSGNTTDAHPGLPPTHGTLMADILLRIAPDSLLEPHDVFQGRPTADPEKLVMALETVRKAGLCRVVNLSLGIPEDRWETPRGRLAKQALTREVLSCYRAGMILVAAAHNAHPVLKSAPADSPPPLVSVTKGDFEDSLGITHHPGDTAEFATRATGYWGVLGANKSSSAAAAHASGLVCRLLSLEPGLGPFEVKTLLAWYARQLIQPGHTP